MLHKRQLARPVAVIHPAHLGDGNVGFIHDKEKVLREIVEETRRAGARRASRDMAGIVLDPRTVTNLAHHLQVETGALLQPLRLDKFSGGAKISQTLLKLLFDPLHCTVQRIFRGHKLLCGIDNFILRLAQDPSVHPVDVGDPFDGVPEELDPEGFLVLIRRDDLDDVAAHPHRPPDEFKIVAGIIDIQKLPEEIVPFELLPPPHNDDLARPFLGSADAVNAAHGCDDDHVPVTAQERTRRPEAQPVDLVVDRGVLGDIRIGGRDVRFRLVVIVVAYEELDPVAREKPFELAVQLRGERLVVRHHEDGLAGPSNDVRYCERLAAPRHSEEGLEPVAACDPFGKLADGLRLVAVGLELGCQREQAHLSLSFLK